MAQSRPQSYGNTDPFQVLVPADKATLVPDHVMQQFAQEAHASLEWTTECVDRLFVGDIVMMRSLIERKLEDNLGQKIHRPKTIGRNGRPIVQRVEDVCVGRVDRVFEQAKTGLVMVRIDMVWSSERSPSNGRRWLASVSQDEINRQNATDPAYRKREVLRLFGSGPDVASREDGYPLDDSLSVRRQRFASAYNAYPDEMHYAVRKAELQMNDDGSRVYPWAQEVDPDDYDIWANGEEEVPDWVLDVTNDVVAIMIEDPENGRERILGKKTENRIMFAVDADGSRHQVVFH